MIYAIPRHELIVCCTKMYSIYGVDSFVLSPDFYRPAAWINGNSITKDMFQRRRCCGFSAQFAIYSSLNLRHPTA